jgi:hypothetical protein
MVVLIDFCFFFKLALGWKKGHTGKTADFSSYYHWEYYIPCLFPRSLPVDAFASLCRHLSVNQYWCVVAKWEIHCLERASLYCSLSRHNLDEVHTNMQASCQCVCESSIPNIVHIIPKFSRVFLDAETLKRRRFFLAVYRTPSWRRRPAS